MLGPSEPCRDDWSVRVDGDANTLRAVSLISSLNDCSFALMLSTSG